MVCLGWASYANQIKVNSSEELSAAIKKATPGDTITLANKTWKDLKISFYAHGTGKQPIVLKAETPGKTILTGQSRIHIAGEHLQVSGLWFKEGFTEGKGVISFRKNSNELANFCRVTNCAITDYNPKERSNKYTWVELWGNNNRVDHCSFFGKTNQGPVMIVGLKGNSENFENNHRIDNNYFGYRPSLGSNGGETLRVGTSHVSMESSKTLVEKNLFEHCNGEVEIISNKTCDNIYRNNLFLESEGTLTLRHGNRCLVEGNVFFGNNKPHTGGIRVINEGHIIQNNLMLGLKGDGFRAPLTIMNGVPNGPANRYNQVKDVLIQNNTFINCSSIELCEGSDKERTAVPENTTIANNLFYSADNINLLHISDNISGISFIGNKVQGGPRVNENGFEKITIAWENLDTYPIPALKSDAVLKVKATKRPVRTDLTGTVRSNQVAGAVIPGNKKPAEALTLQPGVAWSLEKEQPTTTVSAQPQDYKIVEVAPGENTLISAIKKAKNFTLLKLAAGNYFVTRGMQIDKTIIIEGAGKDKTKISLSEHTDKVPGYYFKVLGENTFTIKNLEIDGNQQNPVRYAFISNNKPSSESYNLIIDNLYVHDFTDEGGCFYKAYKGTFANKIEVTNSSIENCVRGLNLSYEKDDIGKYNAEEISIKNTSFKDIKEFTINYYRGGNDESTLGGKLIVDHCVFYNNNSNGKGRIIRTNGIVTVEITNTIFAGSPEAKYATILKGSKNSISNSVSFNSGEMKASSKAKALNLFSSNPNFDNYDTFELKEKSSLKNAGTDGKDIGLIK